MEIIKIEEIELAYQRLKTYIYYDNTELHLRKKLVEFETNIVKSEINFGNHFPIEYLDKDKSLLDKINQNVLVEDILKIKLKKICDELNSYTTDNDFFTSLLNHVNVIFFPKKIKIKSNTEANFITNVKVLDSYDIEKVTAFIDIPIELHIISVLWIQRDGYKFDSILSNNCKGNRLILNKDKSGLLQNSSLFKPYFSQYQDWRDKSVEVADNLLKDENNVLFINLDIKDYFHSTRIELDEYFDTGNNIGLIMQKIHIIYSSLLVSTYGLPENPKTLSENITLLPIGLLSSYIIANHYLTHFDKIILDKYSPAYYGRYVDDILLVIKNPIIETEAKNNPKYKDLQFDFEKYKEVHFSKPIEFSMVEKVLLNNFHQVISIKPNKKDDSKIIEFKGYKGLICQSEKTLMYYFDSTESNLVIDKLKEELDYKSSEFKDLPDDNDNLGDFDKNAFYLNYTDSEGKIRTLKDYKENRYGLTVYLTNKILGATKHKVSISDEEVDKFLKLFQGQNIIEFYRLWEKIFTFLLVNKRDIEYVEFYFNCLNEIDKINISDTISAKNIIIKNNLQLELKEYLDIAHELAISLNPIFFTNRNKALQKFEFNIKKHKSKSFLSNQLTDPNSYWTNRFRKSNMIRHQYVSIPLLNYTKESYNKKINLLSLNFEIEKYTLDDNLLKNSPRPIKFWECTIAQLFLDLGNDSLKKDKTIADYDEDKYFLDKAFELFINANHFHKKSFENLKNKFYSIGEKDSELLKINIPSNEKILSPKIGVANTFVDKKNFIKSLRKQPNISNSRYQDLVDFLKHTRKNNADIVAFPESFVPIEIFSSLVRYSEKNQTLLVTGLEHITINNVSYNFVATVLPVEIDGYKDVTVIFRLKNHYAPAEVETVIGNHYLVPIPQKQRYHIFNWKNIYFSVFYCFELTNITHRSLLRSKIDLLFAIEYNKDVKYFSNLVESVSRDLHCYVVQVNSSDFGDTRISQPSSSYNKDIVRIKGGENNVTILGTIHIEKLREFQRQKYNLTKTDKSFKPLPPDFNLEDVLKRINNKF